MGKTIKRNDDDIDVKNYKIKKQQAKTRLIARKLKTHKGQKKMAEEGNV